jgi:hypothetical protein
MNMTPAAGRGCRYCMSCCSQASTLYSTLHGWFALSSPDSRGAGRGLGSCHLCHPTLACFIFIFKNEHRKVESLVSAYEKSSRPRGKATHVRILGFGVRLRRFRTHAAFELTQFLHGSERSHLTYFSINTFFHASHYICDANLSRMTEVTLRSVSVNSRRWERCDSRRSYPHAVAMSLRAYS